MKISDIYSIIDIDYDVNPKCVNIISKKKMSSQEMNLDNSNMTIAEQKEWLKRQFDKAVHV